MTDGALGRRIPTSWEHVQRYALAAAPPAAVPAHAPIALGANWYREFDRPDKDSHGRYWVARDGKLTTIRGGHCVCLPDRLDADLLSWWAFNSQGREGACVGFGSSRMMSILNRKRFYARWLWDMAKLGDEWADTNPGDDEGTSVAASMEVLRVRGHVPWQPSFATDTWQKRDTRVPHAAEGIAAYRWATTAQEVHDVLANPIYDQIGGIPFVNSWGTSFPRRCWMTLEVLDRLLREDGEAALVTDR